MSTLVEVKGYLTHVALGYKDFMRLKHSFGDANPLVLLEEKNATLKC